MKTSLRHQVGRCVAIAAGMALSPFAVAQDDASDPPIMMGPYLAPMISGQYSLKDDEVDFGYGGVLNAGYRVGSYAFEVGGLYTLLDNSGKTATESGGSINGLWFPLDSLPNTYLIGGFGTFELDHYPGTSKYGKVITYSAGLGNLFVFKGERYDFALRAEVLYRYGNRDSEAQPAADPAIPHAFNDVVLNLGLQLPLGLKAKPAPEPAPAAVVPVETPPDSDGDGVPDDKDQCPGTPPGTQVNEVGCPLPPPPPPCKTPEAGQRVDLSGCAVGDTIVLHGVNFEFDKATLTVNAKTILDGVADSLSAAPGINVEIGGHTDSRGSDAYNEKLSERRSESVMQYLIGRGIGSERMSAHGYGESNPVADNETDEGRELNRRVELKITGASAPAAAAPTEAPVTEAPAAEANPFAEATP